MKKLLMTAMAALTILLMGCDFEVPSISLTVGDDWRPGDIVMTDGTILISDFDTTTIRNFLEATKEVKNYHIVLNTGGGQAFNCVTMINRIQYLQSQGAHITTEIIGYGMSAGTVVFLLGDERIVHTGAVLMLHGAGVTAYGERYGCKSDFPDTAPDGMKEVLCMVDANFKELLLEKTDLTDEEVDKWLYGQDFNYMTAQEAFDLNLATTIR